MLARAVGADRLLILTEVPKVQVGFGTPQARELDSMTVVEARRLLADGDARERVLALWALALRSAAAITMADQLRVEPDPGVRRALAVVLAGNGELDLLVAMSRHDPNVHVRASAVQMVVRFAAAGRVPWSLVAARLSDVAEVRAAVISQLDATSPPELQSSVITSLADDDELVRREAFETCARLVTAGILAPEVLREVLERTDERECMNDLAAWFACERADVLGPFVNARCACIPSSCCPTSRPCSATMRRSTQRSSTRCSFVLPIRRFLFC